MASAKRTLFGELCAEFAGALILILFGVGVLAQVVTSHGVFGDHDSVAWGWGLGVVLGIYTAARVSGAHLNPAVRLALAVFRGFESRKGAAVLRRPDAGRVRRRTAPRSCCSLCSRSPTCVITLQSRGWPVHHRSGRGRHRHGLGHQRRLRHQPDPRPRPPAGVLVTGDQGAFADQSGALYFWVPIVGPLVGGLLGAAAYVGLIERFLPGVDEPRKSVRSRCRRAGGICGATAEPHDRERRSGRAPGRHGVRADPEHLKSQRRSSDYGRVCRSYRSGHDQYPIHAVRPRR